MERAATFLLHLELVHVGFCKQTRRGSLNICEISRLLTEKVFRELWARDKGEFLTAREDFNEYFDLIDQNVHINSVGTRLKIRSNDAFIVRPSNSLSQSIFKQHRQHFLSTV